MKVERPPALATAGPHSAALARQYPHLSWACRESESVADIIFIWHIAMSLLEVKYLQQKVTPANSSRKTATRLSRYRAYLVAFNPKLLPDDRNETKNFYSAMKMELKQTLARWAYYFSRRRAHGTRR